MMIKDLTELKFWTSEFAKSLTSRQVVLLKGQMGAGKTQLVRFLVETLGGVETSSPTYAIHNRYEITCGFLDHFDLYRIENEDDLESTGFWDSFSAKTGLLVIEWPEKIPENSIPLDWSVVMISISVNKDESRTLELE